MVELNTNLQKFFLSLSELGQSSDVQAPVKLPPGQNSVFIASAEKKSLTQSRLEQLCDLSIGMVLAQ